MSQRCNLQTIRHRNRMSTSLLFSPRTGIKHEFKDNNNAERHIAWPRRRRKSVEENKRQSVQKVKPCVRNLLRFSPLPTAKLQSDKTRGSASHRENGGRPFQFCPSARSAERHLAAAGWGRCTRPGCARPSCWCRRSAGRGAGRTAGAAGGPGWQRGARRARLKKRRKSKA